MRKVLAAIAFLMLAGIALAQCEIEAKDSMSVNLLFIVQKDRTSQFAASFKMPFSPECASQLGLEALKAEKCSSEIVGDSFFKALGGINEFSNCTIKYDGRTYEERGNFPKWVTETGYVDITIGGTTGVISRELENGLFEIDLSDLRIPETPKDSAKYLTVGFTGNFTEPVKIKEVIPEESARVSESRVVWLKIPKTPVVRYYFPGFIEQNQQAISLALVCIAIGIIVLWFGFVARKEKKKFFEGIESEEKKARARIGEARKALESGKISEESFKRAQKRENERISKAEAKKRKAALKKARVDGKRIEELKVGK